MLDGCIFRDGHPISKHQNMKRDYYDNAISFESLYRALKKVCKGVRWKDSVVGYEANGIKNTYQLSKDLHEGKYKIQKYQHFTIHEPKERHIVATRIRDRQFQSSLCASGLYEDITEHFIRDNCACQQGRGNDDALKRTKLHLQRYYRKFGTEGWVLKCDVHHFFESINHNIAKQMLNKYVSDKRVREKVFDIIDSFNHGIGLGSETSQLIALIMLNDLDHIIKERLGIKYYVRYMDDFILIHHDKEYLKYCKKVVSDYLKSISLELNEKTTISPLSQGFYFLQWRYVVTETGKVLMLIKRKKISKQRKKLKKLLLKEELGELPKGVAKQSLVSWLANARRGNTFKVQQEMIRFFVNQGGFLT